MPLLYNGLVCVDGRNCFDGGLINPLPILDAIEAGCTDLLVLLTRPAVFRECLPSRIERQFFDLRCAHGNAQLMNAYCSAYTRENAVRDIALGRQETPPGLTIATLCPSEKDPLVERTTRSTEILKAAAIASARRTYEAFGHPVDEFIEVLRPYPASNRKKEIIGPENDSSLAAA